MKFKVITISKEEKAKRDSDPDYVPQEKVIATLDLSDEKEATRILGARKSIGIYPPTAQLVKVDE